MLRKYKCSNLWKQTKKFICYMNLVVLCYKEGFLRRTLNCSNIFSLSDIWDLSDIWAGFTTVGMAGIEFKRWFMSHLWWMYEQFMVVVWMIYGECMKSLSGRKEKDLRTLVCKERGLSSDIFLLLPQVAGRAIAVKANSQCSWASWQEYCHQVPCVSCKASKGYGK